MRKAGRVSRVILLWGAPAAGKTRIAQGVVARCREQGLVLPHLSSDAIRASMDVAGYLPALRAVVYDGVQAMLESALVVHLPVLLDANYLDDERRRRVREAVAAGGGRLLSVLVRCGFEARRERNGRRGEASRVPEAFLAEAHERAEGLRGEADLLLDTDVLTADEAVSAVLGWLHS